MTDSILGSETPGQAATPPAAGNPASGTQTSWKDSLPPEIKTHASIASFESVADLAKSHVNAQTMIGKKGVIVPGEKATDEDWGNFYKGIGVPSLDKYDLGLSKETQIDETLVTKYKEFAQKNGMLPKQAKANVEFQIALNAEMKKAQDAQKETTKKDNLATLKKEWGEGFDREAAYAQSTISQLKMGQEFKKVLEEAGLGLNPVVAKALSEMGKFFGEDKIRGEGGGKFGMTPAEIIQEHESLQAELWSMDKNDPKYQIALQKVESLAKKRYGG